jgi:ketosteroid isomerase-like protein
LVPSFNEVAMTASEGLHAAIERYHESADAFVKGNPEPMKQAFSRADDVTLANPWGPFGRGWQEVEAKLDHAATNYRDGRVTGIEIVARYESSDLACIAEIESFEAKVGGAENLTPIAIRVTSVFRLETGGWKVVNRHADPIMSAQKPESLIQK